MHFGENQLSPRSIGISHTNPSSSETFSTVTSSALHRVLPRLQPDQG